MWVLIGDHVALTEELASELQSHHQLVTVATSLEISAPSDSSSSIRYVHLSPDSRESWRKLFQGLDQNTPLQGIIHMEALNSHGLQAKTAEIEEDVVRQLSSALALTQELMEEDVTLNKGFFFVTSGAQILDYERGGKPASAAVWGFGKVLAREADHLGARMIDLDPSHASPCSILVYELLYPDPENHIAYRFGKRHIARLARASTHSDRLLLPQDQPWRLLASEGGKIDDLQIETLSRSPLIGKQLRVEVQATGLNYMDVLRTIGMLRQGPLGREFYGQVIEIGPDVSNYSTGDEVVGLSFDSFASEVVVDEFLLAPAPKGVPRAYAATLPTTFTTAEIFHQLSGFGANDKVLIHSGAGGTGLAAIYVAQNEGSQIFATCSTAKQTFLRSIGVPHVFDSRSTDFAEQVLEITGGKGVDVVLNSLTGPGFIEASLSCLTHGGRFIELSKLNTLTQDELAELRPDVHYEIIELDVLKERHPEKAGEFLRSALKRLEKSKLPRLTHTNWPIVEAPRVILHMRNARHIGKNVLTMPPLQGGILRGDQTYLVTGGLGGIGSALAPFLLKRGAGCVVLNGRRAPDPSVKEMIHQLQAQGHSVRVEIADVIDEDAVAAMLRRIEDVCPPLGGVIHSVGVLSDASLANMNWAQFEDVIWPKILGAWNLHHLTLTYDLDMFVLFSSAAGVLGNRGQANHSSANAFLDQLARMRRTMGLPGQSIAWGAWAEVGEAEEHRTRIATA